MRFVPRLIVLCVLAACGPAVTATPGATAMPEFSLQDVNPTSATSGQQVGPLAFRGKVSGWYFTHSS